MKKISLLLIFIIFSFFLSPQKIDANTVHIDCTYQIDPLTMGKIHESNPTILNNCGSYVEAVKGQEIAMQFFPTNGIPVNSQVQVHVDGAWRDGAQITGGGTFFYEFPNTNDYTWRGRYTNGGTTYECKTNSNITIKVFEFTEVADGWTINAANGNSTSISILSPIGNQIADYVWTRTSFTQVQPDGCLDNAKFSFNNKSYTYPSVEWDRLYLCDIFNQANFTLTSPNCAGSSAEFVLQKIKFYARQASTTVDPPPPPPPSLTCPSINRKECLEGGISLWWDSISGATKYSIIKDDETVASDVLWTSYSGLSFTLNELHTFEINAFDDSGNSATNCPTDQLECRDCNAPCDGNTYQCAYGNICYWTGSSNLCRNPDCLTEEGCVCPGDPTNTPTPTLAPTATSTPVPTSTPAPFPTSAPPATSSPWFQVVGGSLHAQSSINSYIPYYNQDGPCIPANNCRPALVTWLPYAGGTTDSPGFPLTAGGSINTHYTSQDQTELIHYQDEREQAPRGHSIDANFRLSQQDYQYFYNKFGYQHKDNVLTNSEMPQDISIDELNVFFYEDDLVINENDNWIVNADEKVVVFVNRNLTIDFTSTDPTSAENESSGRIIRADPGGYLAFIVKEDIIISANVGYVLDPEAEAQAFALPSAVDPNVEGVFLADGNLIINTNDIDELPDKKFIGAGTFVGWSDVQLPRTFAN
jgi:hypothetical protein